MAELAAASSQTCCIARPVLAAGVKGTRRLEVKLASRPKQLSLQGARRTATVRSAVSPLSASTQPTEPVDSISPSPTADSQPRRRDEADDAGPSFPAVGRVLWLLATELPRQYEQDFTWDIYSDKVVFVDPVTVTRGKLNYRGMIFTLRLVASTFFKRNSVAFYLKSIDEVPASTRTVSRYSAREYQPTDECVTAVQTFWSTTGVTFWGKTVTISGDDIFRLNKKGQIIAHESAWKENPEDVWKAFKL